MVSFKMQKTETMMSGKISFRLDLFMAFCVLASAYCVHVLDQPDYFAVKMTMWMFIFYAGILTLTHLAITTGMAAFLDKVKTVRMFTENGIQATIEDLPKAWAPKFTFKSLFDLGWPILACFLIGFNKIGIYLIVVTTLSIVIRAWLIQEITKSK